MNKEFWYWIACKLGLIPVGRCDACIKHGMLWKTITTDTTMYTLCKLCYYAKNNIDYINKE